MKIKKKSTPYPHEPPSVYAELMILPSNTIWTKKQATWAITFMYRQQNFTMAKVISL